MSAEFTPSQLAYLSYPHYAVMATIAADGLPQLSTVWFALDDERRRLMFVIEKDSVKTRNLQRDPRFSVSVPNGGRYVVVEGQAEFDLNQDQDSADRDLRRIADRYYGPIEGANQVVSFGTKPRMTLYLNPTKVRSVSV